MVQGQSINSRLCEKLPALRCLSAAAWIALLRGNTQNLHVRPLEIRGPSSGPAVTSPHTHLWSVGRGCLNFPRQRIHWQSRSQPHPSLKASSPTCLSEGGLSSYYSYLWNMHNINFYHFNHYKCTNLWHQVNL